MVLLRFIERWERDRAALLVTVLVFAFASCMLFIEGLEQLLHVHGKFLQRQKGRNNRDQEHDKVQRGRINWR